ncbi:DUF4440 domain-containing protein [Mangrovimonas sp. ST2L15]|uniref:DUF4440 domain-containing protein n=1 Tax=Mangrovimonas sp. ST2L15 TaxID=1645916 RepID=UPI0006B450A4|nr:DUF4440 domain-containing protein [Mangrovimonas sp. ST2L15]
MKSVNLLIFLFLFSVNGFTQNQSELENINKQIWIPFTKAFETKDLNLFKSIHSKELIRVNADGKRIMEFEDYMSGYQRRWQKSSRNQTISFRFYERIHNAKTGSEIGIYKLTLNPNTSEEASYYGKFHVILIQENGLWKILVDYDSSTGQTIGESDFLSGLDMNDINKY